MSMNIAKIVAEMTADIAKSVDRVMKAAATVESLREAGVDVRGNEWDLKYGCPMKIDREALPALRKVVGRLRVTGKNVAPNFLTTNELVVTVRPLNEEHPVAFEYRTKFRNGGKCHIEERVTTPHVSRVLVCRK